AHHECQERRPTGWCVQVVDLLGRALKLLDRREPQRADIHRREPGEPQCGNDHASPEESSATIAQRHSSTVEGNSQIEAAPNARSNAPSSLSQPIDSASGRSARIRAVNCTPPITGGTRNGNNKIGSISSAKRV